MLSIQKLKGTRGQVFGYLSESDALDYYSEADKVRGQWFGQGASELGLSGEVDREAFDRVKDCCDPQTGEFLRQRHSEIKMFDLCVSAPKSVSVMARPGGDTRLDEAHKKAVLDMLKEVERQMCCEVQADGLNGTRRTGSMAAAVFFHDTSRALDPQLHAHCAVSNMTFDQTEQRWKALDARVIYERKGYFQEAYRNSLARHVMALGYDIEMRACGRNGRDKSFEIVGVPPELRQKFSKMSELIAEGVEQFAESKARTPNDNQVSDIAHHVRPEKLKLPKEDVAGYQESQLTEHDRAALTATRERAKARDGRDVATWSAEASVRHAMDHVFARRSVVKDYEVARQALIHGRGHVTPEAIEASLKELNRRGETLQHRNDVATKETLNREKQMCWLVDQGVGKFERLDRGISFEHARTEDGSYRLNEKQREAVDFIRSSQSFVVNLSGAPGVGKTTTLREVYRFLEDAGHKVVALGSTTRAKDELEGTGIPQNRTMTVQGLVGDRLAGERIRNATVILDEAGLVDNRNMLTLLQFGYQNGARFLVSGDSHQSGPVEAGDALRTLEKESALRSKEHTYELTEIERQKANPAYKAAIETMRNEPQKGFDMLVAMGAVREIDGQDRTAAIAEELKSKPDTLVVAGTHAENNRINAAVKVAGETHKLTRMQSLDWTEAERRDARNFEAGQYLIFHKPTKEGRLDTAYRVTGTDGCFVHTVDLEGSTASFSKKQAGAFGVFRKDEIDVAVGDKLIFQTNARRHGFDCVNGGETEISAFDRHGRPVLKDGQTIPSDFFQFNFGYAQTPQKAQGKTVSRVIVSADWMKREPFYVAASRGRENVTIFTTDIDELRNSIAVSDARPTALEMERQCAAVSLNHWARSSDGNEDYRQRKNRQRAAESYRQRTEPERTSGYDALNTSFSPSSQTARHATSYQSGRAGGSHL